MKNELLLKQVIELLQGVLPEEMVEVQISNKKYANDSVGFVVALSFISEEATNSSILNLDGKEIGKLVEPHVTKIQQAKKERDDIFRGFTKPEGSA